MRRLVACIVEHMASLVEEPLVEVGVGSSSEMDMPEAHIAWDKTLDSLLGNLRFFVPFVQCCPSSIWLWLVSQPVVEAPSELKLVAVVVPLVAVPSVAVPSVVVPSVAVPFVAGPFAVGPLVAVPALGQNFLTLKTRVFQG